MTKFLVFLSLYFVFVGTVCFSQNKYVLSGRILDQSKNHVEIGDALLLNPKDSSVVKYGIILEGAFSLDPVNEGPYLIKLMALGYQPFSQPIELNENVHLNLTLAKESFGLEEFSLTETKTVFENNNGDIKVNIENTMLSNQPNPMNLLAKLPNIQVSADEESITFMGRGEALIYLGNRRIQLNELNSISVEEIKSIELIKNPSSKYEAEGRALILIILKDENFEGYRVSLKETAAFKKNFNNFLGVNLKIRRGRLEARGNLDYNQLKPWESNTSYFSLRSHRINTGYLAEVSNKRPQFLLGAGLSYNINSKDYISYSANAKTIYDFFPIYTTSYIGKNEVYDDVKSENVSREKGLFFSNNLNYNRSLAEIDGNLFLGGQYSRFSTDENNEISERHNFSNVLSNQHKRRKLYEVNAFSGRVDFEKLFDNIFELDFIESLKLEAGSKIVGAFGEMDFRVLEHVDATKNMASVYRYFENNYAAYSQFSGKIWNNSFSVGLRTEITDTEGRFKQETTKMIDSTYVNFFPKVKLEIPSYDSSATLVLNYSRNIERPNYSNSSNFSVYINPFFVFSGNMNLQPTIIDEVSATFSVKEKSISLGYTESENIVFFSPFYNETDTLFSLMMSNLDKAQRVEVSLTYPIKYKFWSSTNVLSAYINKVSHKASFQGNVEPYFYFSSNHEFKLPKDFSISLGGWALSDRDEGVITRNAMYVVDAGISKTFFEKLKCNVSFNDIFKSFKFQDRFNLNGVYSNTTYFTDYNGIYLTLSYSFGKMTESSFKNKEIDGGSRMR